MGVFYLQRAIGIDTGQFLTTDYARVINENRVLVEPGYWPVLDK